MRESGISVPLYLKVCSNSCGAQRVPRKTAETGVTFAARMALIEIHPRDDGGRFKQTPTPGARVSGSFVENVLIELTGL